VPIRGHGSAVKVSAILQFAHAPATVRAPRLPLRTPCSTGRAAQPLSTSRPCALSRLVGRIGSPAHGLLIPV